MGKVATDQRRIYGSCSQEKGADIGGKLEDQRRRTQGRIEETRRKDDGKHKDKHASIL